VYHARMVRIIRSLDDVAQGVAHLAAADPRLRRLHRMAGDPPLRREDPGLAGLARIVVAQQVSVASARAIWQRTAEILAPLTAETLLAAPDEDFRRAGLSRAKVKTLRALARSVADGLDLEALAELDADTAHQRLVALPGIGPWTADVYLMFCLGHADAFASGDLALREAARLAFDLDERPSPADLLAIAEAWRPWRGVAARLLWAYYRVAKAGRQGAPL
jgi:DNA-3-methyladenine glycosylase II